MQVYDAPLRDMRFVLHELHGLDRLEKLPAFADVLSADVVDGVLEEAGKVTAEVILPLNASGDLEGCTLENGVVRTPKGFREAYDLYRRSGWPGLAAEAEHGGQGLPECVNKLVEEMVCSANLSFSLYPGLTHGAVQAIVRHGSKDLKDRYLPKMVAGEWAGAMCLTEAQCGTDLGLIRTKAIPADDGSFRISGAKIFISAGEHDLTENIVHLVLARLPDAPPGIKGISMFLVPKLIPGEDGRPGKRNGVICTALEHKMGLKASATCQITYEDATGWLVGQPHRGMQAMFTMMNEERLGVGIQGLGIATIAYQSAVHYAKERLQGRSLSGAKRPDLPADPILVHPDVRKMLLTMRMNAEGCRAVGVWVAQAVDLSKHGATEPERREAEDFLALMTPVVKALFTDLGFESASLGMQVYGGHGYIRDHGMEQFARDARIAMLYEGTNGIQALDLVGRKMPAHLGRLLRPFFHPIAGYIETKRQDARIGPLVGGLERAFQALQLATGTIAKAGLKDPEEAGAAATDYLRLMGLVAMGYMLVRSAEIADRKVEADEDPDGFYAAKLAGARFFVDRILPQTGSLFLAIKAGKASTMAMAEAAFWRGGERLGVTRANLASHAAASGTSAPSERLLTVTELAAELGITPRTIRFYEDKGLIDPPRAGATRVYRTRERARMLLILRGKRLGFSLAEIRRFLDLYDVDPRHLEQKRALLARVRERVAELDEMRVSLDRTLDELRAIAAQVAEDLTAAG